MIAQETPPRTPRARAARTAAPRPLVPASRGWKRFAGHLILLVMGGAIGFALGFIIRIQKDGRSYNVEAPEGSHTTIDQNGNATVTIAGKPEAGKTPAVSPAAELKALLGQWKVVRVEKGKDADSSWGTIFWSPSALDPAGTDRFEFPQSSRKAKCGSDVSGRSKSPAGRTSGRRESPTGRSPRRGFRPVGPTKETNSQRSDRRHPTSRTASTRPRLPKHSICSLPGPASAGETARDDLSAVGIYQIDGDKLKICLARYLSCVKGDQRPKSFAIAPDSGDILFVLERFRPSQDDKAIEGDWTVVSHTENGKPIEDDGASYSFHNDSIGDGFGAKGPYDLDATKQPRQITICWGSNATGSFKSEGSFLASTGSMATA